MIPDERGKFGPYGGQFVPETLMPALAELTGVVWLTPVSSARQAR